MGAEPVTWERVRDLAAWLAIERDLNPQAVEIRVPDKAALIHKPNEPKIETAADDPHRLGMVGLPLFGVPVILDPDGPADVLRVTMSDGTTKDL